MSAFRIIARPRPPTCLRRPGGRPGWPGRRRLQELGGRAFVDVTPALRSPVGRAAAAPGARHHGGAHRGRAAHAGRRTRRSRCAAPRLAFARGALRALVRFRVPPVALLALARPAAGRRYLRPARAAGPHALAALPAGTPAEQRLDRVEQALARSSRLVPRMFPVWVPGLGLLRAAQALAGDAMDAATADDVLRSLPHNVTSRDGPASCGRWPPGCAADAASAAALQRDTGRRAGRPVPAAASCPACCRTGWPGSWPGTGTARWPRSTSGCPAGPTIPTYVLGVLANYLRLDDPELAPDAQFARGARAAEATIARVVADGARRVPAARGRWCAGCCAGSGSWPACARRTRTTWSGVLAHARARAGHHRRRAGRAAAGWPTPTTSTSSTCGSCGPRCAGTGSTCARWSSGRRADYRQELRRRHVPRILLSDGTEPEALAAAHAGAAPGDLVGTPASAGTATAPARVDPRSGRGAPGAGRDPGRPVHRSRLDPAVPDRGRAGDGDGRAELARRRGGPGVRHPGGGRGGRRDHPAEHRRRRSPWTARPAWCTRRCDGRSDRRRGSATARFGGRPAPPAATQRDHAAPFRLIDRVGAGHGRGAPVVACDSTQLPFDHFP